MIDEDRTLLEILARRKKAIKAIISLWIITTVVLAIAIGLLWAQSIRNEDAINTIEACHCVKDQP